MSNVNANYHTYTATPPGQFARYAENNIWHRAGGKDVEGVGGKPGQGYCGRGTPKGFRHAKHYAHKASLGYATATLLARLFKAFIYIIILLVIRFVLHL